MFKGFRAHRGTRGDAPKRNAGPVEDARPSAKAPEREPASQRDGELGGPDGPEPTRYGDWERKGRCIDF